MTHIGEPWLRDLLLAHNNNRLTPSNPPRIYEELLTYGDSLKRIFSIDRVDVEDTDYSMSKVDSPDTSGLTPIETDFSGRG